DVGFLMARALGRRLQVQIGVMLGASMPSVRTRRFVWQTSTAMDARTCVRAPPRGWNVHYPQGLDLSLFLRVRLFAMPMGGARPNTMRRCVWVMRMATKRL